MNHRSLRLLSGVALVLGAAGCVLGGLLHPVVNGHAHSVEALTMPGETVGTLTLLTGTVLMLIGLPGVYGWLAPRLGVVGLIGFVLYFVGNLLSAVPHLTTMAFIGPVVAKEAPQLISADDMIIDSASFATEQMIFGFVLIGGLLVLGIALVRAAGLRWIGAVALASVAIMFVPVGEFPIITGLQIELGRGVVIAALGLLAIRSEKLPTPTADHLAHVGASGELTR